MSEESRIWGDNFSVKDSLSDSFPTLDIKALQKGISTSIQKLAEHKFTGIQEELEFDDIGLLKGAHHPRSFVSIVKMRSQKDIAELMGKLSEGQDFDAAMEFDPSTKKAVLRFTSKKHAAAPNVFKFQSRNE